MAKSLVSRPHNHELREIGKCIYCESTEELTNEHIIPFGLNGDLILRKASCKNCNKITTRFENEILHKSFLITRTALNFRTRHPKNTPQSFNATFENKENKLIIDIPKDDIPIFFGMPTFLPPVILDDRPYENGIQGTGNFTIRELRGINKDKFKSRYGSGQIRIDYQLNVIDYARMIGKIGYCFAIAYLGLEGFQDAGLLSAIVGKTDDIGRWVGGTSDKIIRPEKPEKPEKVGLHSLGFRGTFDIDTLDGLIITSVQLLSCFETPEYDVVVGTFTPEGARHIKRDIGLPT